MLPASVKVRDGNRNSESITDMNTHYLASLFTPETVALFGASDRQDSVGGVVFKNLLTSGFKGRIFAINPKRDEVQGQKAFSSLDEIDETVDLAVVATPASSTANSDPNNKKLSARSSASLTSSLSSLISRI